MRLRACACPRKLRKLVQHILDGFDQFGAVLKQTMSADRQRILDTARHAEHLPSLLECHPSGDQRTAALSRLDHDDAQAQPADDSIAHREISRERYRAWLRFRNERSGGGDRARELLVLW